MCPVLFLVSSAGVTRSRPSPIFPATKGGGKIEHQAKQNNKAIIIFFPSKLIHPKNPPSPPMAAYLDWDWSSHWLGVSACKDVHRTKRWARTVV